MINYTWKIEQLECKKQLGSLENIIEVLHWRLIGEKDGATAEFYGAETLDAPDPQNFIPLPDFDKEKMIALLEARSSVLQELKREQVDDKEIITFEKVSKLDRMKHEIEKKIITILADEKVIIKPTYQVSF